MLEAQGGENDRSPCGTDKTGPLSSEPRPKAKRFFLKFIVVLLRGLRAVRGQEGTFCTLKMSLLALGKKVSEVNPRLTWISRRRVADQAHSPSGARTNPLLPSRPRGSGGRKS